MGKLLHVNLTEGKVSEEDLNQAWAEKYIGARGLGAKYFFERQKPSTPALSAESLFIIMTGPFTGTSIPAAQRMEIVTKSPLTNTYLCSSVGGDFPRDLKLAGWDGIIITGRAEHPVHLSIHDNEVKIFKASIWGKYCGESQKIIKEKEPGAKVACIGPAGEKLVKLASVQFEERSAGRGGPGAVLGFKKLKAISVKGSGKLAVASPEELNTEVLGIYKRVKENPSLRMDKYGTMNQLKLASHFGLLPLKNFQSVLREEEIPAEFDAERWRSKWVVGDTACVLCPILCGKVSEFSFGPLKGARVEGPEYETIGMFGPACGIDKMEAVLAANYWCDQLGLDTISTGSTIAFAMECYERGIINKTDTGGIDLTFGNSEAMVELVRKIGNREGIGDVLAEGSARAAKKFGQGSESFAMQVKGLEYSAYDPRGFWGQALGFGTNVRGGAHNQVFTFYKEVMGKFDRMSTEGKAELVKNVQNERAALDSLQICIFGSAIYSFDLCSKLYSLVTGEQMDSRELIRRGERIYTLERLINCRDGISRKDDYPSIRILEEALPQGFAQGKVMGRNNYDKMLDELYNIRGWDQNGRPTDEKLRELEITD